MSLDDIAFVLEEGRAFAEAAGMEFAPGAMHEVMAHPQALQVLQLFVRSSTETSAQGCIFEPLPTTGVALAQRDDWRDLLEGVRTLGVKTLWFTFHGLEEAHDILVNRKGAFRESGLTVERARALGLRCGTNVYVSKLSAPSAGELGRHLRSLGIDEMFWEVAEYRPHARSRRYDERFRAEFHDVASVRDTIGSFSPNWVKVWWQSVEERTEQSYVRKALASTKEQKGEWQWNADPDCVKLHCQPDLDLHFGYAGLTTERIGNLRRDGGRQLFERATDLWPDRPEAADMDAVYFTKSAFPSIRELAANFGDPHGQKLYRFPQDMRRRWLDLALADHRRF
jgi:hypothetical protein